MTNRDKDKYLNFVNLNVFNLQEKRRDLVVLVF